ncbi:MAG: Gx transporter family protein [Clostridia bacterium]|nr:Gx transporter family protein [Clostridia bacterium]
MFAKQGNRRNRIDVKRLAIYALLVSICLIVGYLENLLSIGLSWVVPGVKLGLSNAVVLILVCRGDFKGAWAVNVVRICLSALLFGSPISFLLSISGGVVSTAVACLLTRFKSVSAIGVSIAAAVTHNVFQLLAASVVVGFGVMGISPLLIALGAVCGAFCGVLALIILKQEKIFKF